MRCNFLQREAGFKTYPKDLVVYVLTDLCLIVGAKQAGIMRLWEMIQHSCFKRVAGLFNIMLFPVVGEFVEMDQILFIKIGEKRDLRHFISPLLILMRSFVRIGLRE